MHIWGGINPIILFYTFSRSQSIRTFQLTEDGILIEIKLHVLDSRMRQQQLTDDIFISIAVHASG